MRWARLLALIMTVLASAGLVSLAQARSRVVMRDGLMYKPHEFSISGDGDTFVQKLRWRSWGGKTAVADGQVIEQVRPSHVNHTYPVRVTLSHRTYCANIHRTVYNDITARLLGSSTGVFGTRMFSRIYNCAGIWRLTAADRATAATGLRCSTSGVPLAVQTIDAEQGTTCPRARKLIREWFAKLKTPGNTCIWADGSPRPGICMIHAWRCVAPHTVNGSTYHVTCTADAKRRRVRFVNRV